MAVKREIVLCILLLALTGCYCSLDEGDKTDASDYLHGCWHDAQHGKQ